ncbi:MAG TPA: 2-oxoglutarate and iron-dependent oxygenase domain-containing protein [Caulobacteraceae bacterium]|jgi:isopenicillin N synthase-like dioxygenase
MAVNALDPISFSLWREAPDAFVAALGASFEQHGFAVIRDHGLDEARIAAALDAAKSFFALPALAKARYAVPGGAGQRGYTPYGVETAKGAETSDLKEFWHVGRELPPGHPLSDAMPANLWPVEVPAFRETVLWLYQTLDNLGGELLAAIALRLELPRDAFVRPTADGNSVLRLLRYPPLEGEASGIRAGAHEDINAITLLLGAEEAGLEILDRQTGWRPVNPPPGALVVNIGDMLARLTNDVLPSTTHRVVNPRAERANAARYSTPFFLHFRPDFLIRTLTSCVSPERPDRYREPITADAFLRRRLEDIKLA